LETHPVIDYSDALKKFLVDACVLIDFIKVDRSIFDLIIKYVGPVFVVSPVVDEVNEIENEEELVELGLIIIEPEIEDAFTAASVSGPTSFQDRLCLNTAKRYGFTCVTNDINLRKLCEKENIPILWSLEFLSQLHKAGGISAQKAIKIAQKIHKINPKHITVKIVERFTNIIKRLDR
jgi:predicted nucleic acid-binding protein